VAVDVVVAAVTGNFRAMAKLDIGLPLNVAIAWTGKKTVLAFVGHGTNPLILHGTRDKYGSCYWTVLRLVGGGPASYKLCWIPRLR
jgi:hypothetical protein